MINYTFEPREHKGLTAYAYASVSISGIIEINIYVYNADAESVLDYRQRIITDDELADVIDNAFTEAFKQAVRKQKESDDDE